MPREDTAQSGDGGSTRPGERDGAGILAIVSAAADRSHDRSRSHDPRGHRLDDAAHDLSARAWLAALAGRFLVFDGPDGSGKSTQMARFIALCREHGLSVSDVREPGGTPIGEQIRSILLDPVNTEMTVRCEMLLYMASRAQLVIERIEPALAQGHLVLSDRFVSSTLAYQGTAGGLSEDEIRAVAAVAVGARMPDLVVIFDVDEVTSAKRLSPLLDRMEQKGLDFHRRVRAGYLAQAARDPDHHLVVDASREPDEVFAALLAGLAKRAAALAG